MDFMEFIRRWKRAFDGYLIYRKLCIIVCLTVFLLLYLSPNLLHLFPPSTKQYNDVIERCLEDRLAPYERDALEFNANIRYIPSSVEDTSFIPFVGNGLMGIAINSESPLHVKTPKTLLQPLGLHPITNVEAEGEYKEAIVSHYVSGTVTRFQCFRNGLFVKYEYLSHRTIPHVFIQEIKLINPTLDPIKVTFSQPRITWESDLTTHQFELSGKNYGEYNTIVGVLENVFPTKTDKVFAYAVSFRKPPRIMTVKGKFEFSIPLYTTLQSEAINKWEAPGKKDYLMKKTQELTQKIASMSLPKLKEDHTKVWNNLWKTGMSISVSKAAGAINGDRINATMYYVLSNVRSLISETNTSAIEKNDLIKKLQYTEGCYGYHHTLQAPNLWSSFREISDIAKIASYWLLTLEKQGCHKLVDVGAEGVLQAMVLSFGGFRFALHHLEFNIHPKFLHRDYHFRRIAYGNNIHINVTVTLQENNKALIGVSVDKQDEKVYACDGGCIDDPVEIGEEQTYFPVKLTDPITAILYVTTDKRHMELFKQTLHVKEIAEAPAHEHHVIALHRHGHHLGGLPTLFWASVCFLIVVFHLFLFKLIYNEYCGKPTNYRSRYGKS